MNRFETREAKKSENWNGYKPTYKLLDDYSGLIGIAQNKTISYGDGTLSTTVKMINSAVYENYLSVGKLANHLMAKTIDQTVFNFWHWVRKNIRYKYDKENVEQVRTPQRLFFDGFGDCDCMTVFVVALAKCLRMKNIEGHIVTFKGRGEASHIYPVIDGYVCDTVLSTFDEHPNNVMFEKTKKIKFL